MDVNGHSHRWFRDVSGGCPLCLLIAQVDSVIHKLHNPRLRCQASVTNMTNTSVISETM